MIQTVYGIACQALRKWVKPLRDSKYRAFVRSFPCCGCGQSWWVDATHTGPHALSRKASDLTCIPLCRACHEAYDKAPAKFAYRRAGWSVEDLAAMYLHLYLLQFPERGEEFGVVEMPAAKKEAA